MFKGKVISGHGIGKKLGYPTANLDTPKRAVRLGAGIYAAYATCRGRKYPSALVIRSQPLKVEVHFLEYDGTDCYGLVVRVDAVQKVSELETYQTPAALKKKISDDIRIVRRVLKL